MATVQKARSGRPSPRPGPSPVASFTQPEARDLRSPTIPAGAILPLRLFLGITFIYAGLQKFTDPQFFGASAPGYIGRQLAAFAHGSPLSGLLTGLAIPHATFFGALIALDELWIGIAATLGLLTRIAAVAGFSINLILWLTATWHVTPYFMGSDIVFCAAWLALALSGPGLYALDHQSFTLWWLNRRTSRAGASQPRAIMARAAFLRGFAATATVAVLGTVAGAIAKVTTPQARPSAAGSLPAAGAGTGASGQGYLLGNIKSLAPNQAATYTDPTTGDPALLVHLPTGTYVSYDAVCTHAGCTVQYDPQQRMLVCPCHGATFDPARRAAVVSGPAGSPLPALAVRITANGNAYRTGVPAGTTPVPARPPSGDD